MLVSLGGSPGGSVRMYYQKRKEKNPGEGRGAVAGGQSGNRLRVRWAGAWGGGALLTARFRPSAGADNGVAVPSAPSPCWAARVRPLSPKLLSI